MVKLTKGLAGPMGMMGMGSLAGMDPSQAGQIGAVLRVDPSDVEFVARSTGEFRGQRERSDDAICRPAGEHGGGCRLCRGWRQFPGSMGQVPQRDGSTWLDEFL